MSEKRRDKKNRILRNGESQRKDGRYMYKYNGENGYSKYLYSWRLDVHDAMPNGKKPELSLREKEKILHKNLMTGLALNGDNITVLELVQKYLSLKTGVRHNTASNYKFVVNIIKKEPFGNVPIRRVKQSDAKAWFIKLQKDGRGYSTIHTIRGVIRPAFELAVNDDLLIKNPFQFPLSSVVINDSVTREAVSPEDMERFLNFVRNDNHFSRYYEGMYILFHTGLRISEFVGLTIKDIDFKEKKIHVNHQLQRKRNMEYIIEDTKTSCGTRDVPMTKEVADCFRKIIANRKKCHVEPMIDGYVGFLYLDKNDKPMVALHWEKYFAHVIKKYNKLNKVQIPKITPHMCRHTFCSNMAKAGMNPKTLQYIMGHADISVTMNTYTHVSGDDALKEMERLCVANM